MQTWLFAKPLLSNSCRLAASFAVVTYQWVYMPQYYCPWQHMALEAVQISFAVTPKLYILLFAKTHGITNYTSYYLK
jgi:hypothetical protein